MIRNSTIVALLALCIEHAGVASQPLSEATQNNSTTTAQSQCNGRPIGRVLSQGDHHFKAQDLLCKDDHLDIKKGATVQVECFATRLPLEFTNLSPDISTRCNQAPQAEMPEFCAEGSREHCAGSRKGPSSDNAPALISPYGNTLISGRPFFSWRETTGATSYKLEITRGEVILWQKKVAGTTLAYPLDQPPLQFGKVYKIIIIAKQGDLAIKASNWSVHVLPQIDVTKITKTVDQLNHLGLAKDEEAYLDLDNLYMSWGLIGETIKTLEEQIKVGSKNSKVYQTLGDRYLQAGLPDYAKTKYEAAARLAQKNNNLSELARAEASLRLVTH